MPDERSVGQTDREKLEILRHDLFRATPLRYAGYANELTEAVKHVGPLGLLNPFGWLVALVYGCCDALHKGREREEEILSVTANPSLARAECLVMVGEVLLFHVLASWVVPVYAVILPVYM